MNKRIRKKKYKQSLVECVNCKAKTEWFKEEDEGCYCPSCFADLVGISVSEVWGVYSLMRYLKDLAERKYNYYCRIYKKSPQAYTTEQCYERIILKSKYEELTDVIDYLPLEHQELIDKYYDELLGEAD